jgi:hypothetical protein
MSLSPGEVEFLRRLASRLPESKRANGISRRMAELHGIGRINASLVLYGPDDLGRARAALAARGIPVEAPEPGFARSQAGPGLSEKIGARPVTDGLLAAVPMNMRVVLPENASFLGVPWQAAGKWSFDALLICENFEPLMRLAEYTWLADFVRDRKTLAVFRGGPHVFRPSAVASLLQATTTPVLAFVDFDPAGLAIAADIPRLEELCLPPWELLREKLLWARRPNLFFPQLKSSRSRLEMLSSGPVWQAWTRLQELQMGLDQESFPR